MILTIISTLFVIAISLNLCSMVFKLNGLFIWSYIIVFKACVSGRYGDNCTQICPPNCHGDICNNVNGSCVNGCKEGYIESNLCQEGL